MILKRAIMVLSDEDHFELKKWCTDNKKTIQEVCFEAMNLYLKTKGADMMPLVSPLGKKKE